MNALSRDNGGLLRFTTAGSVDDGKSSLIGRMLYDAGAVTKDRLATLERIAEIGRASCRERVFRAV